MQAYVFMSMVSGPFTLKNFEDFKELLLMMVSYINKQYIIYILIFTILETIELLKYSKIFIKLFKNIKPIIC